ncbi:uncharacterized protein Tco025E_00191 [Trypanosoma conorhini]|uniref:Uncharacterized protein n=1 Tax=Trypanosoma conorhini TaxID=83891 RepID=A0A422QC27_9TRYP|nr:uncharacterized protein Tco025E_00191 [Trypanosoma conorhini]RNF27541.1 hypothetical protein Tco025E_00191 [Trypanosoma conorhini]
MRRARPLKFSTRLRGRVVWWHPFERRGVIRCEADGKEYNIPSTRAFETILPTRLRHLEGATVEFEAIRGAQDVDRVITRSRLEPITTTSYARPSPVDFLAGFRQEPCREATPETAAAPSASASPSSSPAPSPQLFAGKITVDLSTVTPRKGNDDGEGAEDARIGTAEEEVSVRPPLGVKDLRNPVVLDVDTRELLRLRHQLGDDAKAREALQQRRTEAEAAKVKQRKVLATHQAGVVLAWSSLHRSGVVLANATKLPEGAKDERAEDMCIIRNVDAFDTALPTELNLVGRAVSFAKVVYASHPVKVFAENIIVSGKLHFDASQAAATETRAKEAAAAEHAKRAKQLGTLFEEIDYDHEPLPTAPLYGVVTRWSGGQGIVETGNRRLYYIQSAADFKQLIDQTSNTIRGAVVRFTVDRETRRNARAVDILSLATRDPTTVVPMLERRTGANATPSVAAQTPVVDEAAAAAGGGGGGSTSKLSAAVGAAEELPADAAWVQGTLIAWSPLEDQGVIEGDDGNRYLLRDGEEDVRDYKTCKSLLKKGRRVKFLPFGGTGRLACHVVPLDAEADAAALAEAALQPSEPRVSEGHAEEAIASPMSTAYWISRMDRAGYDTTEVKQMQGKAITFDDDDDEDDKLLDTEDLFKKDHWFNDPRKNMRLPNSDMTAGNLALIGPASMMNIAMKAHNPQKLEKVKNKYYNRLSEPMKEFAWKQAKELAPKYEKRIKEAREKGVEPRFSFY